jgi:hypothetical protein
MKSLIGKTLEIKSGEHQGSYLVLNVVNDLLVLKHGNSVITKSLNSVLKTEHEFK